LQVKGTTENVTAMQAQFITFQQSINQLTQSLVELHRTIAPQPPQPADDDNANLLAPMPVGVVLDNRVGHHQSSVPDMYYLLRMIFLGSQSSQYPDLMVKVMWRITLLGSSRLRHCGVCMLTLKIRRSNLRPQKFMAMHALVG
jgi:hypothetical protein